MKQKLAIFLVFILTLGVLYQPTLKTVKAAEESDLLVKNDFSTGAEGWQARGATIEVVTEGGLENSANVKVSGRTANWHGVQKDMLATALAGSAYDYSVYVYFEGEAGSSETMKLSAQVNIDGEPDWNTIAEAVVPANTWTELAGSYTLLEEGTVSEFVVYVEATKENLDFSIDEFTLRGEATTSPTTSWTNDFEMDLGIWGSRTGTEKVEIVTTLGHESTSSAKVWERSQYYHGIATNAASLFVKDKVYQIEFYVYQESGNDKEIYLTMQKQVDAEATSYTRLATAATKSGEWTKVNTSYSYTDAGTINELVLYFEAEVGLEFYLDDVSISTSADEVVPEIQKDLVGIKELYEDHFSIGVAIPDQALSNELMKELVVKHFNSITAENSMKPEAMLDASYRGQVKFEVSDLYEQFASENDMGLRGHTLVWHSQTPDWFFKVDFRDDGALVTREVMLERMENYIKVVAEHYKNTSVYAWDVVNEAVESSRPDGMRKSLWYDVIGPDFVYKAFEYARKYTEGTDIKLFYNDYSVNDVAKRTAIINLLTPIKEAGLIDGMGIQGHINMTFPSVGLFSETIGLFEDMDLEVQVTELDISVYENDNERMETASEELLIRQGYRYKQLFDMFKTHEGVTNITIWGLKDDMSWLNTFPVNRNNFPLLFDKNYQAKYAYWGIVDGSQLPSLSQDYEVMAITEGSDSIPVSMNIAKEIPLSVNELNGSMKVLWSPNKLYIQLVNQDEFVNSSEEQIVNVRISDDESVEVDLKKTELQTFTLTTPLAEGEEFVFSSEVNLVLSKRMKRTEAKIGQVVVDGSVDGLWSQANSIEVNTFTQNTSGATAIVKTLYTADALYVLAQVTDGNLSKANANPWEQDSVELFIDENMNRSEEHQADDVQYRINYENEVSNSNAAVADQFQSATSLTETGYIVEMKIPMQLGAKKPGDMIGFDVQINDDQGSAARDSMSNWYDLTGTGWRSTKAFGTLIFSAAAVNSNTGNNAGNTPDTSGENTSNNPPQPDVEFEDTKVPVELSREVSSSEIEKWFTQAEDKEINKNEGFSLTSEEVKLTLDKKTLESILEKITEGEKLQVDVKELTETTINELLKDAIINNEELRNQIQDRPIYQFQLSVGDEKITEFDGKITIQLPYELREGENPNQIVIYYLDTNGEIKMMKNCRYDEESKTVSFKTKHFSLYMISAEDVVFEDEVTDAAEFLGARGFIQGRSQGIFDGDVMMTRAELVQLLMNLSGEATLVGGGNPLMSQELVFADVFETNWYYSAVTWAANNGIVQGFANQFRPDEAITQEELVWMLHRFMGMDEEGTESKKELSRNEVVQMIADYLKSLFE